MKNIGIVSVLSFLFGTILYSSCVDKNINDRFGNAKYEEFVFIDGNTFAVGDSAFFPIMVNYKVEPLKIGNEVVISPARYYENTTEYEAYTKRQVLNQIKGHMQLMKEMGFNSIRVCMDVLSRNEHGYYYHSPTPAYLKADESLILNAIDDFLDIANEKGLKVMLLIKPPFEDELKNFAIAILKHCANNPTLFAYDFMNEPLYFDPAKERSKEDALDIVSGWKEMVDDNAPHQLFTIGFSEPIEVFEWDPSILPVDFVQFHTYHPLRVPNEIWWYANYVNKPWIIGETSFSVDNDSLDYNMQTYFMKEVFQYALNCGAAGFGWWEFQDAYDVHFEAQYSGLLNHKGITTTADGNHSILGTMKPAANEVKNLKHYTPQQPWQAVNYYNMLGYNNIVIKGIILDPKNKRPIEGAVVRGWNEDWSVGMNTFTNKEGVFTLYSNDECTHFEVSAPGMSKLKFDNKLNYSSIDSNYTIDSLPNRKLEYHNISYVPFLLNDTVLFSFDADMFDDAKYEGRMDTLYLIKIER